MSGQSDPFNIVKDELNKSVSKTRALIESYNASSGEDNTAVSAHSRSRLLADINSQLKSISWDILDLDETIKIASKSPAQFNLTYDEIEKRRAFLDQTRDFVQRTRRQFQMEGEHHESKPAGAKPSSHTSIRIPDILSNTTSGSGGSEYTRLMNNVDESDYEIDTRSGVTSGIGNSSTNTNTHRWNSNHISNTNAHSSQQMLQHQEMFAEQDRNLDLISGRVSSLKNISQTMQVELDDQAMLLDDIGREMDTADSRMNAVMKKITKVLHMSNDRRQWTLIGVLIAGILFILILFAIL